MKSHLPAPLLFWDLDSNLSVGEQGFLLLLSIDSSRRNLSKVLFPLFPPPNTLYTSLNLQLSSLLMGRCSFFLENTFVFSGQWLLFLESRLRILGSPAAGPECRLNHKECLQDLVKSQPCKLHFFFFFYSFHYISFRLATKY